MNQLISTKSLLITSGGRGENESESKTNENNAIS